MTWPDRPGAYPFDVRAWQRFVAARASIDGAQGVGEGLFRLALAGLSAWGWAQDEPAPPPRDPVLVIGHQRSGTTWLHRLLASHPDASALPLHALILPSDRWQSLLDRPRPAWLERVQDRRLAALDAIHRIRLHEAEEDEFALWPLFRSPTCAWDRPWPAGKAPRFEHDDRALGFYTQVVARASRRSGRRHVGKNPHFTHLTAELRRHLPGLRFVLCVRHPEEAIPSRLSLIRAIWRLRVPGFEELAPHQVELIYQSSLRSYRGGLRADLVVRYDDLVRDPVGELRRVEAALGFAPRPAVDLEERVQASRSGAGVHRYALSDFGLTAARLRADLADVYLAWGFR